MSRGACGGCGACDSPGACRADDSIRACGFRRLHGDGQHERAVRPQRAAHGGGRLEQRALALGEQQRGFAQPAALERALPQPVAPRPVAGGGRVEADRARSRPEERCGRGGVDQRARMGASQPGARGASRGKRPAQVGEHQGAHLGLRRGARDVRVRAGAAQRGEQLIVDRAQPAGGAERDDQDVEHLMVRVAALMWSRR